MMSGAAPSSSNGSYRKKSSEPAIDPEILGADTASDPWRSQ